MGYSGAVTVGKRTMPLGQPGVVWVPLEPSHSAQLARLLAAIEESEGVPYRTSQAEVEGIFAHADKWVGVAGLDETDPERMVAFGYVTLSAAGEDEAVCQGGVCPSARSIGIGSKLLEWQTRAGADLVASRYGPERGRLTHTIHEKDKEFREVLNWLGYVQSGGAAELRTPVRRWRTGPPTHSFLEIVPWDENWDDPARRAFNQASAALKEKNPATREAWLHMNAGMNRDWSFVALDRGGDRPRVVGLISVGAYEQDWEALGWREGVLQILAAFDPRRRAGILSALLDASFEALQRDGMDMVSVTVDPDDNQETFSLYRDNGFEVSAWYHTYSLSLANS